MAWLRETLSLHITLSVQLTGVTPYHTPLRSLAVSVFTPPVRKPFHPFFLCGCYSLLIRLNVVDMVICRECYCCFAVVQALVNWMQVEVTQWLVAQWIVSLLIVFRGRKLGYECFIVRLVQCDWLASHIISNSFSLTEFKIKGYFITSIT